jgi:hypothetical protein
MTTDSIVERARVAARTLNEQEDYERSLRYMSDDELRAQLVEKLREEKAVIARWLDAGDCYLISGAGRVHLPSCPSMRRFMDRDAAWAPYLDDLERVRDWHGDDNAPPMATMRTRAQVESLRSYRICPTCAPTLDHTDKRTGAKGWTALQAGSLNRKHLGTSFCLAHGTDIGTLTRLAMVETLEGTDFHAGFDGLEHPVNDPAVGLMYRTGTRPQTS